MNSLEEADVEFLKDAKDISVLPLYAYGGISTPRDVALMMEMKCTGVFVDNSIFTSDIPRKRLKAMVKAVEYFNNMDEMIKLSIGTAERY
ncbi:Pyridoxal 5'-phosphate synthase subunit snz1 [Coemansia furcata]|nr:Pyridoxal 5'-phosphate synthase subunit snz1 [Coemansia furcata]